MEIDSDNDSDSDFAANQIISDLKNMGINDVNSDLGKNNPTTSMGKEDLSANTTMGNEDPFSAVGEEEASTQ